MVPWRTADRVTLVAGSALGLSAVVIAWFGASGESTTSGQLAWVALGAAGIVVSGLANALWLLTGRRAVGRRRRSGVLDPIRGLLHERTPRILDVNAGLVVAGPSMTRYHRPNCLLVAGKRVESGSVTEQAAAGRSACGMCAP